MKPFGNRLTSLPTQLFLPLKQTSTVCFADLKVCLDSLNDRQNLSFQLFLGAAVADHEIREALFPGERPLGREDPPREPLRHALCHGPFDHHPRRGRHDHGEIREILHVGLEQKRHIENEQPLSRAVPRDDLQALEDHPRMDQRVQLLQVRRVHEHVPGELLAVEAIRKIEEESHLSGLTDKIKEFLEKNGKAKA